MRAGSWKIVPRPPHKRADELKVIVEGADILCAIFGRNPRLAHVDQLGRFEREGLPGQRGGAARGSAGHGGAWRGMAGHGGR